MVARGEKYGEGNKKSEKSIGRSDYGKFRVTVISSEGDALFDTGVHHSHTNYNTKPEVIRAIATGRHEVASRLHDGHYRYYVARVFRHPYRPSTFITVRITFARGAYQNFD